MLSAIGHFSNKIRTHCATAANEARVFFGRQGMSFGGWISGVIFDMTGSYKVAFLNGLAWNALNVAIVLLLLLRSRRRAAFA
jgi:hypothetical protein